MLHSRCPAAWHESACSILSNVALDLQSYADALLYQTDGAVGLEGSSGGPTTSSALQLADLPSSSAAPQDAGAPLRAGPPGGPAPAAPPVTTAAQADASNRSALALQEVNTAMEGSLVPNETQLTEFAAVYHQACHEAPYRSKQMLATGYSTTLKLPSVLCVSQSCKCS